MQLYTSAALENCRMTEEWIDDKNGDVEGEKLKRWRETEFL